MIFMRLSQAILILSFQRKSRPEWMRLRVNRFCRNIDERSSAIGIEGSGCRPLAEIESGKVYLMHVHAVLGSKVVVQIVRINHGDLGRLLRT